MTFINLLLWVFAEKSISIPLVLSSLCSSLRFLSSFGSSSSSLSVFTSFPSHMQWYYLHLGLLQLIFSNFYVFLQLFFFTSFDHSAMNAFHILISSVTVLQVSLERNLRIVADTFFSFLLKDKTLESVLSLLLILRVSALLRDWVRELDSLSMISNAQAFSSRIILVIKALIFFQYKFFEGAVCFLFPLYNFISCALQSA